MKFYSCFFIICSWDLERHIRAHNGEEIRCDYCGKCYSKKSNLFNHLNRGKGCPRLPDSIILNKETERNKVWREEKIKYAVVKQETGEESDKEPSDLVIDDCDQSDIMDTNEVKTETEEDQDKYPEEHMEVSRVEVQESRGQNFQSPGLDFLQAQRDFLRHSLESESNSTPSPPQGSSLLMLLADVAMNQRKYSDRSREGSPVEAQRITPPPLNLTTTRAPASKPSPPLPTTYRDIRPRPVSQIVTRLQPAKRVPGQTTTQPIAPAPVLMVQRNLGPMIQANGSPGHVPLTNGSPGHVPQTNRSPGHVPQTNGGTGHVSHVPSGLIQLAQTTQVIRLPPGGASLLRTNTGRLANIPSLPKTLQIKPQPVKMDQNSKSDIDQETDSSSDFGSTLSVKCPTCGRVCSDVSQLSSHIKLVHSDDINLLRSVRNRTVKCNSCNKMFGSSSNLALHKKNVHEGNKRVECNLCGKGFARKSSLNQHFTQAHVAVVRNSYEKLL